MAFVHVNLDLEIVNTSSEKWTLSWRLKSGFRIPLPFSFQNRDTITPESNEAKMILYNFQIIIKNPKLDIKLAYKALN